MFANDYRWKNGLPVPQRAVSEGLKYKLISDPYNKHISIERYLNDRYESTIYDSKILDFRKLKPADQTGWSQELTNQGVLIRDMDDRVVHIEHHEFEDSLCRTCKIYSPHNWLASIHRLYYTALGDPFNGVILFDPNDKPVMEKKYQVNDQNEFTELISEEWNIPKH